MRVLMLAESYAPVIGGEERIVQDLSRELVARGHSVAVATLCRESRTEDDGIRVHRLPSAVYRLPIDFRDTERRHALPAPDPETVLGLRRVMRAERPDVVHAHNWLVHAYSGIRGSLRAPLVLSLHDYALNCATKRLFLDGQPCSGPELIKCVRCAGDTYGPALGGALAVAMRVSCRVVRRGVQAFIPISDAVREGCQVPDDDRCRLIPNFIGELPPPPTDPSRLDEMLPREPFILFFGDASVDKGAGHLAAVYARLHDPPPLVFAGRCFLPELSGMDGVWLTGVLPRELIIETVRRAMFTVVPSLWAEPFGMVALEAAAVGRPVIASAVGGLTQIVRHDETGLLVDPGDQASLEAALCRLIEDPVLRERLGTSAARQAQNFSAAAIVPRFEAVYDEVRAEHIHARA